MAWPKVASAVTLNATGYVPVLTDYISAKKLIVKARTSVAVLFSSTPNPSDDYYTLAAGAQLEFDIGGTSFGGTVGSELLTNGTFTGASTGWTLGTGWAYSANTVVKNADGTGTLSQNPGVIAVGGYYKLVYTISAHSVGDCIPSLGGVTGVTRSADGTYTEYFLATATDGLAFTPTNTSRFTIDTISLKRLTMRYPLFAKSGSGAASLEILYY